MTSPTTQTPTPATPATTVALGLCAGCGQPIKERGVEALNQRWHPACFVCDFCRHPLLGQCLVKYGRAYCEDCERRLYGNYCDSCDQPIVGQLTHALNKYYHPNHFICARCKGSLQEGYAAFEGKPYCKQCASAMS